MERNPFVIIKEYLDPSNSPQVRKNALAALATLATDESITELVNVLLTDEDTDIRNRAEDELIMLNDDGKSRVIQLLQASLDDKNNRNRAYYVLGRLCGRGVQVTMHRFSILKRLGLAASMSSQLYPTPNWRHRLRSLKPGISGGILGAFILYFVWWNIAATNGYSFDTQEFTLLFAGSVILSAILVVFATQFGTPINLYLDRIAAVLIEVVLSGTGVLILSGIAGVICLILDKMALALFVAATAPALVMGIRTGTILAAGVFPAQRLNKYAQTAVGAVVGIVVVTLIAESMYSFPERWFREIIWLVLLPASVGIAKAFSAIDSESMPVRPIAGKAIGFLSLILTGILVFTLLIVPSTPQIPSDQPSFAKRGRVLSEIWPIVRGDLQLFPIKADFEQEVMASTINEGSDESRLMLLNAKGNRIPLEDDEDADIIKTVLKSGNYRIATQKRRASLEPSQAYTVLSRRFFERAGPFLILVLNSDERGYHYESGPQKAIPDNNTRGIQDTIQASVSGKLLAIKVGTTIKHTKPDQLKVHLTAPDGTRVELFKGNPNTQDKPSDTITYIAKTDQFLDSKWNRVVKGNWVLHIQDTKAEDEGTLQGWTLDIDVSKKNVDDKSVEIPDKKYEGIVRRLQIPNGQVTGDLSVSLDITHSYHEDLRITLTAPDGTDIPLQFSESRQTEIENEHSIWTWHSRDVPGLMAMRGRDAGGDWQLRITDVEEGDQGKLNRWAIEIIPPIGSLEKVAEANESIEIPEKKYEGIVRRLSIPKGQVTGDLSVSLDITHSYHEDLRITLTAPDGTDIPLQFSESRQTEIENEHSIWTWHSRDVPGLMAMRGRDAGGDWQLRITDVEEGDQGKLNRWAIEIIPPLGSLEKVAEANESIEIPDNNSTGVVSRLNVPRGEKIRNMAVSVDITHAVLDDISVTLSAPNGWRIRLPFSFGRTTKSDGDATIWTWHSRDIPGLMAMRDRDVGGDWRLRVADTFEDDKGWLNGWWIEIEYQKPVSTQSAVKERG